MGEIDRAVRDAVQAPLHRNLIWRIGALAAVGIYGVGQSLAAGVIQPHLRTTFDFVIANWGVLSQVAASYGGAVAVWFHAVMSQVPEIAVLRPWVRAVRPAKDEDDD